MKVALPIRSILKPSSISMLAVLASFSAWLFPSFGVLHKGFRRPSQLDLTSGVLLACWYALIFVSFYLGQEAGGLLIVSKRRLRSRLFSFDANFVYYSFTILSVIGIVTALSKIFASLSLQEALLFISLGRANSLKDTLYEDYSIGLVSLRYLVLYSASLALYRIIALKQYSLVNLFNILLLGVMTLLSSRLIFIATLLTTIYLASFGNRSVRISIPKLLLSGGLIFIMLAVLNISRNAAFYERQNLSFSTAGISEIVSYLGTPFQAAIASAKVTDQLIAGGSASYRNYVDLEINYMTNSAFVHLHEQMGYWAWLYIALICSFMGFAFEFMASFGKTLFLLPCGAILYGSAELWRLDLFQQGTFLVWFVIGIGLPAFTLFGSKLCDFIAGAYRTSFSPERNELTGEGNGQRE